MSSMLPPTGNLAAQERRSSNNAQQQALMECLIDRIMAMRKQESIHYNYRSYFRNADDSNFDPDIRENNWREKIVHWTYSVVDHFDLSREVVAISLSLFDRFLATRDNRCNGNSALLISLTTLHISIKLNEAKRVKLSTLANLSRGQFGPSHIEECEWRVLVALSWRVHPPTEVAFVSHLLQFVSQQVHPSVKKDLFELSRYLTELSMCDVYFVEFPSSTLAYASILNVMEEANRSFLPGRARERFISDLSEKVHLHHNSADVVAARDRLRTMFAASLRAYAEEECSVIGHLQQTNSQGDDASSKGSLKGGLAGRSRSRSGSYDSAGSWSRYSASPRMRGRSRHRARSPCTSFRNRAANSPSCTTVQ